MKLRRTNLLAVLILTGTILFGQQKITIDINTQYQTIYGFGASDAWNFEFVGKYWSDDVKNDIAKKLFSRDFDSNGNPVGIGLSRWRFNVGAGSAEQGDASNIEALERRVECFLNEDGSYNWEKQAGQQWFLKKANNYGVEGLVAFLNSPPRFYTNNGRTNSDNTSRGGNTNLKADHYGLFANFMTTVLKHFEDSGIVFSQISPVNEPQYEWNNGQEGCPWQNIEIKTLVDSLNKSIVKKGLNTKILLSEAASYNDLHQVNGSAATSDQIWRFFNNSNAEYLANNSQVLPGIGGHSYWTDGNDATIRSVRQNLKKEAMEQGNIELYQTEYNLLSNSYDSKLINTLFLAKIIYADLAIAGVSIWDYWTAIERERWSQLNRFYLLRLKPEGGDYADLTKGGSIGVDKNLWALGNYSRFIRPGYKRVKVSGADDLNGLMASGFIAPDTSELVLVYVNWSTQSISVTHALENLESGNTLNTMTPYITSSIYNLSKRFDISGSEKFTIPPRSIITVVASLDAGNISVTNIDPLTLERKISIYPNPTNGSFNILTKKGTFDEAQPFQIFNNKGKLIMSGEIRGPNSRVALSKTQPDGIYFIRIDNRIIKLIKKTHNKNS